MEIRIGDTRMKRLTLTLILLLLLVGLVVYLNIPKYDLQAEADREGNTLTTYKDGSTLKIYANGTQVKTEPKFRILNLFNQ